VVGAIVARRMATASPPSAASRAVRARLRAATRAALPAAASAVVVAGVLYAVYRPSYINYDARYALVWARDVWNGLTPDFTIAYAPTPHPLQTALSSLALPFGDGADDVLIVAVLLFFGLLGWLAYRLGAELFAPAVGVVAAAVVLTRPAFQRDALIAYQDIPFACLIVGAVLLEARRPRRGVAVLVLLALAGLMRPEAWVLSVLYFAWLWPTLATNRRRAALAALALAAPALWALTDLAITGDPLHSLHGTSELAERAGRRREVDQVPYWTAQYFGYVLREPLVIGVPIGLVFAWLYRRRPALLPLAVAIVMVAVFAAGPVFGLPLIGRYVRTPSVLLALFYGLAVCGWLLLRPGRARQVWTGIGALALGLSLAWLPWHVQKLSDLEQRIDRDGRFYAALHDVARSPGVRSAFAACGTMSTADHRPVPHLRWWLEAPPFSVQTTDGGRRPAGPVALLHRDTPPVRRFYGDRFPRVKPPAGQRPVYRSRYWTVYAAPRCTS
jgi:hypothetical protein